MANKWALFLISLVIVCFASSTQGNILPSARACEEPLYVQDKVVIDVSDYANCNGKITTDKNHILVFSLVGENDFEQAFEFLAIHDGLHLESPVIQLENQIRHEVGSTSEETLKSIYTSNSEAVLRLKKMPPSTLKLKIEKAVDCPFNLGPETQCGRVVDDSSCYCATFGKRSQGSSKSFCASNGFQLLSVETNTEETKIYLAWGFNTIFWTSLTDLLLEGTWIWETTNETLYPGYANWAPLEPNNMIDSEEDCVYIRNGWYDAGCGYGYDAICELQPTP